jgi:hypothetical protein
VRRLPFDEACPNFATHRTFGDGSYHALDQKSLAQQMLYQLTKDPDACEPLGRQKQGARGALFKLTLESHGYTFVAKGTVLAFKSKLKHEGSIYRYLDAAQGELIPVYLGNISLTRPYFLDFGVRIVHMLLMSWGGEQIDDSRAGWEVHAEIAWKQLLHYGVKHNDMRAPNVLWNSVLRKAMLVDFERSEILRPALQEISPNKLKRLSRPESSSDLCTGPSLAISDPIRKADPSPSKFFDGARPAIQ